jgi:hypothetical protein
MPTARTPDSAALESRSAVHVGEVLASPTQVFRESV